MTDAAPSEKIVGLFTAFRENEAEIERMNTQVKQKTLAQESVQRELDIVTKNVGQLDIEHHRLRRVLVRSKEFSRTLEMQITKEKEAQCTAYMKLIQIEEATNKLEDERIEKQLLAARKEHHKAQDYLEQRRDMVDAILEELMSKD